VESDVQQALKAFTRRFCDAWHDAHSTWPQSEDLYGVPSPCIISTLQDRVIWQPQPFEPAASLSAVERAMDIVVQEDMHAFYTTQYAGDMAARFDGDALTLLQTWSEDDFRRVQENLIGHLVTQKRLKLSPTLFIATRDDEMEVVSLCNLTGEVTVEKLGTRQRTVIAPSLSAFLSGLEPQV